MYILEIFYILWDVLDGLMRNVRWVLDRARGVGCKMLKIGICDRDTVILNDLEERVEKILADARIEADIYSYESEEEFYRRAKIQDMDILFLEVAAEDFDGIKIAEYFREHNNYAKIIYISEKSERFRELYHVGIFDFIDKPIDQRKFQKSFRAAYENIRTNNDLFWYYVNKTWNHVVIHDIKYFESEAHVVKIHLEDAKVISFYGKLSEIMRRLSRVDFLAVNKSFLINMEKIKSMGKNYVVLKDGSEISISRSHKREVYKRFCQYIEIKNHR